MGNTTYSIHTILKGQRFYFNRNSDTVQLRPIFYEYEDEDELMCTIISAVVKTSDMRDALLTIDLDYEFELFIEDQPSSWSCHKGPIFD